MGGGFITGGKAQDVFLYDIAAQTTKALGNLPFSFFSISQAYQDLDGVCTAFISNESCVLNFDFKKEVVTKITMTG